MAAISLRKFLGFARRAMLNASQIPCRPRGVNAIGVELVEWWLNDLAVLTGFDLNRFRKHDDDAAVITNRHRIRDRVFVGRKNGRSFASLDRGGSGEDQKQQRKDESHDREYARRQARNAMSRYAVPPGLANRTSICSSVARNKSTRAWLISMAMGPCSRVSRTSAVAPSADVAGQARRTSIVLKGPFGGTAISSSIVGRMKRDLWPSRESIGD